MIVASNILSSSSLKTSTRAFLRQSGSSALVQVLQLFSWNVSCASGKWFVFKWNNARSPGEARLPGNWRSILRRLSIFVANCESVLVLLTPWDGNYRCVSHVGQHVPHAGHRLDGRIFGLQLNCPKYSRSPTFQSPVWRTNLLETALTSGATFPFLCYFRTYSIRDLLAFPKILFSKRRLVTNFISNPPLLERDPRYGERFDNAFLLMVVDISWVSKAPTF